MILKALIEGLKAICNDQYLNQSVDQYEQIPENQKNYVDIIIKNVNIKTDKGIFENQELALQYKEEKKFLKKLRDISEEEKMCIQ